MNPRSRARLPLAAVSLVQAVVVAVLAGCWNSPSYPPLERHRVDASNHGTYFPIDPASIHQGIDCEACHGGTPTFLDFSCLNCHDHAEARTDSAHAGISGYSYASSACYQCHLNGTAAGVDHSQFFPIGPGSVHSAEGCADCHPVPTDHRVFTCISCHTHAQAHTDSTHAGVAGYQHASSACLACHPNSEVMTRAQHERFFPIASGRHDLACDDCHTTALDYTKFECILRHDHECSRMDPEHSDVSGYSCLSSACYQCHPTGQGGGGGDGAGPSTAADR